MIQVHRFSSATDLAEYFKKFPPLVEGETLRSWCQRIGVEFVGNCDELIAKAEKLAGTKFKLGPSVDFAKTGAKLRKLGSGLSQHREDCGCSRCTGENQD